MTVWTPALLNPGDTLTAEEINTLLSGPYYHLAASSDQTISNNAATPLSYNTVTEYNSRYASVSTPATSLAVPIAGTYLIVATVTFAANATGVREAYISAGGSTVGGISVAGPSSSRPWVGQVAATKKLSAGGTVAVYAYQNCTASLATSSATMGGCRLAVTWLGLR